MIVDGDGRKKNSENTAPERAVPLGFYEFERYGAGAVYVTNATISKEAYGRLTNSDYIYLKRDTKKQNRRCDHANSRACRPCHCIGVIGPTLLALMFQSFLLGAISA